MIKVLPFHWMIKVVETDQMINDVPAYWMINVVLTYRMIIVVPIDWMIFFNLFNIGGYLETDKVSPN